MCFGEWEKAAASATGLPSTRPKAPAPDRTKYGQYQGEHEPGELGGCNSSLNPSKFAPSERSFGFALAVVVVVVVAVGSGQWHWPRGKKTLGRMSAFVPAAHGGLEPAPRLVPGPQAAQGERGGTIS